MIVKMKKYIRWIVLGGVLVALITLYAKASSSEATAMVPRASVEWSRGRFIGHTPIKQPVALQPATDGGVFLVWPNLDGRLELARIGGDGDVLLDRVLPVVTKRPRDPQLELGLKGRLHLLWREQSGARSGVHYAMLEADGIPVSRPLVLSDIGTRVLGAPQLARDRQGLLQAWWADDAGIHWAMLDGEGGVLEGPTLLIPGGHSLLVRVDGDGWLHLVWQQEARMNVRDVTYATFDPEKGKLSDPEKIAEIVLNDRLQLDDVAFGLSQDTGYVLWSQYDEGFDRYMFMCASFSLSAPQQKQVALWHLRIGDGPMAISLPDRQQTPLPVALSERIIGLGPEVEGTSGGELAHYVISNESAVASGDELTLQITLITIGMAQEKTVEHVITASAQASMKPVLATDDRSFLHLAWLETAGFGQYRLVYASTAPEVLEAYNALTLWDVLNLVLSRLFQLSVVVVGVIVTFIMWAIIPLLGLTVYHLVTSEETLDTVRSRVALIAVLVVEVALTFVLPPRIAGIEAALPVLRWGVPAIGTTIAAVVTASVIRRRGSVHLFATFFLFTVLNNLLQTGLHLVL